MIAERGSRHHLQWILTVAAVVLVGITPLGREATAGPILIIYRSLLMGLTLGSIAAIDWTETPGISPVFVGLCGLTAFLMWVSVMWNPGSSFDGFYRWYQYVLFGAALLAMATATRNRSLRLKSITLYAVTGVALVYLVVAIVRGQKPFLVSFVNPNYYASFLLVGFSTAIAILLFENRTRGRIFGAVTALGLYYGMTQAWSRGATVSAVAVVLVAVFRFSQGRGVSRLKLSGAVIVFLAAFAFASPMLARKFLDRGAVDPYNYQRPKIWRAALQIIGEHPLLGVGPGEFFYVSKRYTPPVEGTVARFLKRPVIAHSEYLQAASESGIPAALLLFGLGACLYLTAINRAHMYVGPQRLIQEAAILTATGLGVHALVDNNWTVPVVAAGLVVFSSADILPLQDWRSIFTWSRRTRVVFASILTVVIIHGILLPGLAVSFNEAGQAAYDRQHIDRAESMYRLAAAFCPNSSIFLSNAGVVYFDKYMTSHDSRWLDYAETFFLDAAAANPNSDEPWHHLERLLLQRLTGNANRDRPIHQRIVEVDRDILRIDPVNPFVRKNLAEALYNMGDHEAAERELTLALQYEPNYVPAYLRLSDWFSASGDAALGNAYRDRGLAVVVKYRNEKPSELYESLLLGRPQ